MNIFRLLLSLAVLALTVTFLASCESSKIAYGNSYYFKQTPKKINQPPAAATQEALASVAQNSPASLTTDEKVKQSYHKLVTLAEDQAKLTQTLRTEKKEMTRSEKKDLRQEKRANKREMRKELKTLIQEYRAASPQDTKEALSAKAVSGNLRTGIIIGAVGLILLIIGGPVLYPVGAILLVVGLVFILIDVV